jgi:hypothetical protein
MPLDGREADIRYEFKADQLVDILRLGLWSQNQKGGDCGRPLLRSGHIHAHCWLFQVLSGSRGSASGKDLVQMPPIHTNVVKRSIPGNVRRRSKDPSKKAREFHLGHLAGGHRELAMVDAPVDVRRHRRRRKAGPQELLP